MLERAWELKDGVYPQCSPKGMESWEGRGACGWGTGCSGHRVTGAGPLLPSEAFLIPAPYYGAITQHVCLYGNVRLVCVHLDSEVRVPENPGKAWAFFLEVKTFLSLNLRGVMGGSPC